jgi:hypothetical protein
MKKTSAVLILVAVLLALACALGAQNVPQPRVEQKIMVVPGNKDFTGTGFTIGPADRVTITATGKVYFLAKSAQSGVGPDGWPRSTFAENWPDQFGDCADPLEDAAAGHAALIADVNNQKFLIGATRTFFGKNGLLYLGINDCSFTGSNGNSGQFNVTVKVERNAIPVKK